MKWEDCAAQHRPSAITHVRLLEPVRLPPYPYKELRALQREKRRTVDC